MKKISISELRKLTKVELEGITPAIVTFDGSIAGIFCSVEGVIVIEDLHPRVQRNFRNLEAKARRGMPPTEKLFVDELRS